MNTKTIVMMSVLAVAFCLLTVVPAEESDAATYSAYTLYYGSSTINVTGTTSVTITDYTNDDMLYMASPNSFTVNAGSSVNVVIDMVYEPNGEWQDSVTVTFVASNPTPTTYSHTLYYNANGGSGAPSTQTHDTTTNTSYSFTISSTQPTRANHTFLGWSTSSGASSPSYYGGGSISVSANSSKTLYAVWQYNAPSYTCYLYYNANNGSGAPSTQSYTGSSTSNHTFTISNTEPTRTNYAFLGWSESSSATTPTYVGGNTISVGYSSSKTLYAVWGYSFTLDPVYGVGANGQVYYNNTLVTSETTYKVPVGSRGTFEVRNINSNYAFLEWEVVDAEYGDSTTQSENPLNNYAIFNAMEITPMLSSTFTYTVHYNANGGSNAPADQTHSDSLNTAYTFTITASTPTRSNYTFWGWSESSSATTPTYYAGGTVSVSPNTTKTLYAVWGYSFTLDPTYSVGANGQVYYNNSLVSSETTYMVTPGSRGTFEVRNINSNYAFLEWAVADGDYGDTTTEPDNPLVNYAIFNAMEITPIISTTFDYTVHYIAVGGSNIPADQHYTGTVNEAHTFTIPSTTPAKTDYTFWGWSESSSATTPTYYAGGTVSVSPNTTKTLYAVWGYSFTLDPVYGVGANGTVTYNGNVVSAETTYIVEPGSRGTFEVSNINSNYAFLEWTVADGNYGDSTTQPENPLNNYAIFNAMEITPWLTSNFNFTLQYNANGGSNAPADQHYASTVNQSYTFTITSSTPTRTNYTFWGWADTNDAVSPTYSPGDTVTVSPNTTKTLYAVWGYSFTLDPIYGVGANGQVLYNGDVITEETTYMVAPGSRGTFEVRSINPGYRFSEWVIADGDYGDVISESQNPLSNYAIFNAMEITPTLIENQQSLGSVWWDNGYINGSATIVFDFSGRDASYGHKMTIPIVKYDGIKNDADGIDDFTATGQIIGIEMAYKGSIIMTLTDADSTVHNYPSFQIGEWTQYQLKLDVQNGYLDWAGIKSPYRNTALDFSFTNYNTIVERRIVDFSNDLSDAAFNRIYHEDTGTGTSHPHFQVVTTNTYLDTFSVVMTDPIINIVDQFPDYDDLRLNLYSFAVYGDSLNINGYAFDVMGSKVRVYYTVHHDPIYDDQIHSLIGYDDYNEIASPNTPGAKSVDLTLSNIYITWENIKHPDAADRMCYLTFVDANMTFRMGTFDPTNLTISFDGIWYFTTALWEPYQAFEKNYTWDYHNPFNLDRNGFILIFIAISVAVFVLMNIFYRPSALDYAIVIGSGIIAYVLLGGF